MLTNPCTQQWSEIERTDGMHYCELSEKNIVDLILFQWKSISIII